MPHVKLHQKPHLPVTIKSTPITCHNLSEIYKYTTYDIPGRYCYVKIIRIIRVTFYFQSNQEFIKISQLSQYHVKGDYTL